MKVFLGADDASIGAVLRVYRKTNNLTQRKVAEYLDIDRSTYAKYETGRKPEIDVIMRLSVLYKTSLDDFMKSFFAEANDEVSSVAAVASPETSEETTVEITKDEYRLLSFYRACIRKYEAMKAVEEIYKQDKDIIDET
ncbi:MAG: helix-turn-helix transcriptional regulator [Clostridia bacterium]|nr:helix-turn-helix transcriptional regulator [Clostridia bacterium]